MKELYQLFWSFFKIGLFTFGGGYAMLPMLQREIVEGKKWAKEEEIASYYAIGQTTPGIIAVNTATFVGYKQKGIWGAIFATIGLVLPGMLIIMLLVRLIVDFSQNIYVRYAMNGIKVAVTVLIFDAILRLRKSALVDRYTEIIFLAVCGFSMLFPMVSPAFLIIGAGLMGMIRHRLKNKL